jgi:hypothetical protein
MGHADNAITEGNRESYNKLVNLLNKSENSEKEFINTELFRVKKFYIGISRFEDTDIVIYENDDKYKNEEIPVDYLIECLLKNDDWKKRARAANCLGLKRENKAIESIITAIVNDPILDVIKESIVAFERITGFKNPDVLNFGKGHVWWVNNKENFQ